jgi:hypothetical protein
VQIRLEFQTIRRMSLFLENSRRAHAHIYKSPPAHGRSGLTKLLKITLSSFRFLAFWHFGIFDHKEIIKHPTGIYNKFTFIILFEMQII